MSKYFFELENELRKFNKYIYQELKSSRGQAVSNCLIKFY